MINNINYLCKEYFLNIKYILSLFIFIIIIRFNLLKIKKMNSFINSQKYQQKEFYDNNTFIILKDDDCKICGLMAYYKHYLVCINNYISLGYIPIIDLRSFPNILNGYNITSLNVNPWEIFFNQPFGYELDSVLKNAKNIKYARCKFKRKQLPYNIFLNAFLIYYWHIIAINYIPIKNLIYNEAINKMNILFKGSNNILGILIRGTDYLARKPKKHPITPDSSIVINDIKLMDKNNNYNYYFIATEDDLIRNKFKGEFGKKLKFIKQNKIKYNYNKKYFLSHYKTFKGNINNMKIYLINIIILSKCLDIITARTSGSIGAFILSNGFRNSKVYFLGEYN